MLPQTFWSVLSFNIWNIFVFFCQDFVEPSVTLFEEGQLKNTNKPDIADLDIPDLESVGFEKGIDSIHVSNGVWVSGSKGHGLCLSY